MNKPRLRPRAQRSASRRASGGQRQRIDPIKAEVIARYLLATSEETAATLMRTAFSPNIKERGDCSTAVFSATGDVIALAHRIPIHLGSMVGVVEEIRERFGGSRIRPGDMFVANDPYSGGGTHLPDITVAAPVFVGDDIVAFVANIAHHADVGGMVPGSEAANCTSIFQEGIRIPPVRIMNAGELDEDVLAIVLLNSRTPAERQGDLKAQFASNVVGIRSVQALYQRYGVEDTDATIAAYLDFTERRFVAAIDRLPSGVFEAQDALDGAKEGTLAAIRLKLEVGRGKLAFDFGGSDPQMESARNIPYRALLATIYTVAKCLLDPEVPANAGYYRAITVKAPLGSVVNPRVPAAVGCRSSSCAVLGDVIAAALTQALPAKALACSGPHHLMIVSGTDPRTEDYFVSVETVAGGMGARANRDGMDGVRVHASGSSNLPIEALEHTYPMRVERYALWEGSGGAGKYRGGMGVVRDYRMLGHDMVVTLAGERQNVRAQGMAGGSPGAAGMFVLDPDTARERQLGSAVTEMSLERGTVVRICTPAGGGYGDPGERAAASMERDVREDRRQYTMGEDSAPPLTQSPEVTGG
ncbi:MAG: hydantoinase B/oxoprolinase family protein [Burkholderiales bacterium]|nr:hydantoinase B/oxoprolinase family protein [Burkholderiales bacterium]